MQILLLSAPTVGHVWHPLLLELQHGPNMHIFACSPPQDVYQPRGEFKKAKTALTIHNIAFQVRNQS